jgi:ribonuclease Z
MLPCVALEREGELFLFDCGEGAQIGLRRYGLRWGKLAALFISHLHGDHITGILGLLMSLQMADRVAPLALIGPPGLERYVRTSQRLLNTGFGFHLEFVETPGGGWIWEAEQYAVRALPLDHRTRCIGFRLEESERPGEFHVDAARRLGLEPGPAYGRLQRGESVAAPDGAIIRPDQVLGPARPGRAFAYVTDTRPCEAGVELARHADLLIHEGTFAEAEAAEAHARGHSTVVDAARIAARAGARQLVITHISPRYADSRPLEAEARAHFPQVSLASDGQEVEIPRRDA